MRATFRNSLAFVMLCGLSTGCGDDPKPEDTGNTQSDDSGDAGSSDDSDEADNSDESDSTNDGESSEDDADQSTTDESTSDDETDDSTDEDTTDEDTTNDVDLPDPVLEDLPPETPLSELEDDELAEVCRLPGHRDLDHQQFGRHLPSASRAYGAPVGRYHGRRNPRGLCRGRSYVQHPGGGFQDVFERGQL